MHVIPTLLAALLWPFVGPPDVYLGHERQLQVRVPRLEVQAVIDGRLDEAAWATASVLTGFSQFSPLDGVPAADSTQVLVWYSPTAIHFGIRAFEQHGAVHATLANRDKITADDHVQILLGTFRDQRQATLFAVNPLGVQMDGTIVESGQALSAGFTGVIASRVPPDLSQDYVFTSKGRLTEYGYEVEIRIPFRSIKFQPTDVQAWDINVLRQVQHSGYEDSWAPALRDKPSFLAQGGSLEGLRGLERGLVLDLNPIVTQKVNGAPGAAGWSYDGDRAQIGMNARWGVTNGLTLNGTVRPDFAEVESDAGQLVVDPRSALFFAEKRPFFLDGLEQFSVPSNLIYTRRIGQPIAAAKLTGKVANTQVAFLSAVDDPGAGATGPSENAVFNILRAQRDIGGQSRIGMAYTDRILGSTFNRVANVDGRIVSGSYSANIQMAASVTKAALGTLDGPLWNTSFTRSGKTFGLRYYFSGIDPDFQAASGFISRSGIVRAGVDHIWKWFGPRGATVEGFSLDVLFDDIWQYRRFVRRGDAQDKKFHVSTSTTVRGGWIVGASIFWETFGFDERFYSNYSIERTVGTTVDTIPFIGVPRIPNRDYVLALTTPQFSWGSGSFFYVWGQDENFFEWAQADINFLSANASLRPSAQMRVDGSLSYQDFRRRTDGSIVGKSMIPRVKLEYQLSRSIFVRAVGEYQTSERDDLRDETRTFFPLLINGKRALAFRSAGFTGEYLFSYLPHPGTVVFLGYGSQAEAIPDPADRFTYKPLVRDADHFFAKLSYLFRM